MMTRDQIVANIAATGLIPCWRHDDTAGIIDATKALADIGITNVELTMTMPGTLRLIEQASAQLPPEVIVGVGTVLDAETARVALLAGARYVVSPILVPEIISTCHRYNCVAVPGVSSPTEIVTAQTAGADLVKIFPSGTGTSNHLYLAELRSVFPGVRTVVTGGTTLSDIPGFMSAGADAQVVGMPTMALEAYTARRWSDFQKMAQRLQKMVKDGREPQARQRLIQRLIARYTDLDGAAAPAAAAASTFAGR